MLLKEIGTNNNDCFSHYQSQKQANALNYQYYPDFFCWLKERHDYTLIDLTVSSVFH